MARGRFISNEIVRDKKINDLSDDTSRLAFTWLITMADREGRAYGDPALLKSLLFPRREDITPSQIEYYIKEWADADLILWYEVDGEKFIYFPKFEKHQVGLRKDREAPSTLPEQPGYAPDELRSSSGKNRVNVNVNVKLSEDNETPAFQSNILSAAFVSRTGIIPHSFEKWIQALDDLKKINATPEDIEGALDELGDGYTIVGIWSIVNAVRNVIRKKNKRTESAKLPGTYVGA